MGVDKWGDYHGWKSGQYQRLAAVGAVGSCSWLADGGARPYVTNKNNV